MAANVWLDDQGIIRMYVARSDAWSELGSLLKVTAASVQLQTPQLSPSSTLTHSIADGTVTVVDGSTKVIIFADSDVDVVRILVSSGSGAVQAVATLDAIRTEATVAGATSSKWYGSHQCNTDLPTVLDTVPDQSSLPGILGEQGAALWHRNSAWNESANTTIFSDSLKQQLVDPAPLQSYDPLSSRVARAALLGTQGKRLSQSGGSVRVQFGSAPGESVAAAEIVTGSSVLPWAGQGEDPAASALLAAVMADGCTQKGAQACAATLDRTRHVWEGLWNRSYVNITAAAPASSATGAFEDPAQDAAAVLAHYYWQRFLSLAGGRRSWTPLKFNGELWTVPEDGGKGSPDARQWGGGFWSQNTRQAFHEALASGDDDVVRSAFLMYQRASPVARAREQTYWPEGQWPGAFFFPETTSLWGSYIEDDLGWGCGWVPPPAPQTNWTLPDNTYLRYYYSGSLELALIALDEAAWSGDDSYYGEWAVPLADGVVGHYWNAYSKENLTTPQGTTAPAPMDMFPSNGMETYQCKDLPPKRDACSTNSVNDVAGLTAVLARLLALPAGVASPEQTARWQRLSAIVPPLARNDTPGAPTVWTPGLTFPSRTSNSENVMTQVVWPYRMGTAVKAKAAGPGSPDAEALPINNATYDARPFPCNDGWCNDLLKAAALGRGAETATALVQRASSKYEAFPGGWPGFSSHLQDFEPSLDHWSWSRTAVHTMLLQPLDDAKQRFAVFPAWAAGTWDVAFKLRGPGNTVVEAECSAGKVVSMAVQPASRAGDVLVEGCGGGGRTAAEVMQGL